MNSNSMKKKGPGGILSVALVLILALASLAAILPAMSDDMSSAASSGTCGDGVVWSYSDRTLTISYTGEGSGRMDDMTGSKYECGSFHGIRDIRTVIFKDGVTYIGKCCFEDMKSIEKVVMADTITEIGYHVFWMSGSLPAVYQTDANPNTLKDITWSKNLRSIGADSFRNIGAKNIYLPNVEFIDHNVFDECVFLESLELPSIKHIEYCVGCWCKNLVHLLFGNELEYVGDGCFSPTRLYGISGELLEHTVENMRGRIFDGKDNNLKQTGWYWPDTGDTEKMVGPIICNLPDPSAMVSYPSFSDGILSDEHGPLRSVSVCAIVKNLASDFR